MPLSLLLTIVLSAALGASAVADFLTIAPRVAMVRHLGLTKGTEAQLGVIAVLLITLVASVGDGVLTTLAASFYVGYFLVVLALHRRLRDAAPNSVVCAALAAVALALAVLASLIFR